MYVSCIFCELVEAFDCVNHDLLLLNLNYCGIQDEVFRLV